jgi:hypothetical protein
MQKLGWMTPRAYASALSGEVGRDAALRWGSAPRPLAIEKQKAQINPGLSLSPDEKRGSPQSARTTGQRWTTTPRFLSSEPSFTSRTSIGPPPRWRPITVPRSCRLDRLSHCRFYSLAELNAAIGEIRRLSVIRRTQPAQPYCFANGACTGLASTTMSSSRAISTVFPIAMAQRSRGGLTHACRRDLSNGRADCHSSARQWKPSSHRRARACH